MTETIYTWLPYVGVAVFILLTQFLSGEISISWPDGAKRTFTFKGIFARDDDIPF